MTRFPLARYVVPAALILGLWLGVKYLLPLLLPFLLGLLLALTAEPVVRLLQNRCRLPRGGAAGVGISLTLLLLAAVMTLLGGVAVRELGILANALPDLERTAEEGAQTMENWLLGLANRAPDGMRSGLTKGIVRLFAGGTEFLEGLVGNLPAMAKSVLGWLPDGVVSFFTGILSAYLISARLPKLRRWLTQWLPAAWQEKYLPALKGLRRAVGCWLRAQLKLGGWVFLITCTGFFLLRVSYAPLWALVVAAVDAVPLLGTGTVLIPWSLVCFLQGNPVKGAGLLGIYAVAALTRSMLEPRLVGKQLGLDPLVTLVAFYVGYQLWGLLGMILAPMLAAVVTGLVEGTPGQEPQQPPADSR